MKSVLVVEDSKQIAKFEKNQIETKLNLPVIVAHTMKDAIAAVEKDPTKIMVALLDLSLPDAYDAEVVDAMLERGIPSIIFTSIFSNELRDKMLGKGVLDYVLKSRPANFDIAIKLIDRIYKNSKIGILVVDDSKIARKMVTRVLHKHFFKLYEAQDGQKGYDLLQQHSDIKLVITDENMPNMRGAELVDKIRIRRYADTLAIIGLSSAGKNMIAAEFLKAGANDFLSKPFVEEELICRVNQNLELLEHIEQARKSAFTDFLTGLYNRRFLFEKGKILYTNALKKNVTMHIAIININAFGGIKNAYGYDISDQLLYHIAELLKSQIQKHDILARFEGAEYCMISINRKDEELRPFFEAIQSLIENTPLETEKHSIKVTISIGVSGSLDESFEKMLHTAVANSFQATQIQTNYFNT